MRALPDPVERVSLTVLGVGVFLCGFVVLGAVTPVDAAVLRTPLDDAVPFVPWTVLIYSSVYPAAFYPLFVVRSRRLFRRTVAAYFIVIFVGFATFIVFPVTAIGLRPDISDLERTVFWAWDLHMTYEIDPPYNMFPSLHLAVAWIASLAAWKARRAYGWIGFVWSIAIGISTWTVKQHWIADSISALVLAHVAYFLAIRSYDAASSSETEHAYSWRGPAIFFGMLVPVYAGAYVWFRLSTS